MPEQQAIDIKNDTSLDTLAYLAVNRRQEVIEALRSQGAIINDNASDTQLASLLVQHTNDKLWKQLVNNLKGVAVSSTTADPIIIGISALVAGMKNFFTVIRRKGKMEEAKTQLKIKIQEERVKRNLRLRAERKKGQNQTLTIVVLSVATILIFASIVYFKNDTASTTTISKS